MTEQRMICHVHRSDKTGCFWLATKSGLPVTVRDVGLADEFTMNEIVHHVQYLCAHNDIAVEALTHPIDSEFVPDKIKQLVRLD